MAIGQPNINEIRLPTVAGLFYAADRESLRQEIENCFKHKLGPGEIPKPIKDGPKRVRGLVVPHAGYIYSGPVAAHAYAFLAKDGKPNTVIILGPNHSGVGAFFAVSIAKKWRTPLGDISVDRDLAKRLIEACPLLVADEEAHRFEHSIEVQLPFLQYLYDEEFRLVAISMLKQDLDTAKKLGTAIAQVIKEYINAGKHVVILASTDFTHYEPQEKANFKDQKAIEAILKLDPELLWRRYLEYHMTMCGIGPVLTMLYACKQLECDTTVLLKYATSGDVTGDYASVVGYSSIAVLKKID